MHKIAARTAMAGLTLCFVAWTSNARGQDVTNPADYYPLAPGDLWQSSLTFTGLWPDSVIVTAKVQGDTLMPNGHIYRVIDYRADSAVVGVPDILGAYGAYQRLDTATATVYTYLPDAGMEFATLQLVALPDSVPPPDSPFLARFDSLGRRAVFGQERSILSGFEPGSGDAQRDRAIELAEGIGTVKIDEIGGAPLTWRHVRLLYAHVGGREYGERVATSVAPYAEVPSAAALGASYPNPFRVSTRISFAVGVAGRVRLAIYDLLGREVAVLIDRNVAAGNYEAVWEPNRMLSGLYVCELVVGDRRQTRLLTYLK